MLLQDIANLTTVSKNNNKVHVGLKYIQSLLKLHEWLNNNLDVLQSIIDENENKLNVNEVKEVINTV